MAPRTKEVRYQERRKFIEHNLRVEEILFHSITKLAEDKMVTAVNVTALAMAAEALVQVQKRII